MEAKNIEADRYEVEQHLIKKIKVENAKALILQRWYGNRAYQFAVLRLYVALCCLSLVLSASLEPLSLVHRILNLSGPMGWISFWVLGSLSLIAVADVVVNDFMSAAFNLRSCIKHRHLIYMLLATGLVSVTYVMADSVGFTPVLGVFWLHAVFAVFVAFASPFQTHRKDCVR